METFTVLHHVNLRQSTLFTNGEALILPPERRGVNRGKKHGFQQKNLKEYTWGGLLKKVYEGNLVKLNCCGKIYESASSTQDHI